MPIKKNKSAKKKTKQQRDRGNAIGHNLVLPLDIIGVIAKILQTELQLKTCANLNVATRAVYQETLPTLYKVAFLRYDKSSHERKWKKLKSSPGAKHIQYLIEIDEEWRIDPTVVDPSRPLHTIRDIPDTCCKATVTVIHNSNPGINIVVVYIWESYEYGGSDLPALLNSIGLVYQMCKLKRNPSGTVGNTNRLVLIAMSYANAYLSLESSRSQQYPYPNVPIIVDEVDLYASPMACCRDTSPAINNIVTEFATLLKSPSSRMAQVRQANPLFIMWPRNPKELLQAMTGICSALERNPGIVTLNIFLYCEIPFDLDALRTAFDAVVNNYNRAFVVTGQAGAIKIAPPGGTQRDWSSVLYTCRDAATHSHISHLDGHQVAIDLIDHRGDRIVVTRGDLQNEMSAEE